MTKITGPGGRIPTPLGVPDQTLGLDRLDAYSPASPEAVAGASATAVLDALLGLDAVPPQAGSLGPPAVGEGGLSGLTGPQVRGSLRRVCLQFRHEASRLTEAADLHLGAQGGRTIRGRVTQAATMVELVDRLMRDQDVILTRMATDGKA